MQEPDASYRNGTAQFTPSDTSPAYYLDTSHVTIIGGSRGRRRRPPRIQFFHFRIHFHRKVPASEVGAPPQQEIPDPPLTILTR